jgi:hypothetical protein
MLEEDDDSLYEFDERFETEAGKELEEEFSLFNEEEELEEEFSLFEEDEDPLEEAGYYNLDPNEGPHDPPPKKGSGLTMEETLRDMIQEMLAAESDDLQEADDGPKSVDPESACDKARRLRKAFEKTKEGGHESSSDKKDLEAAEDACKKEKQLDESQARRDKVLIKEHKTLNNKVQKLNEQNNKYRTYIQQLKEHVEKVNLSNAKLLYQNRVLNSTSLNERQKDKIVETIKNANSVEEAKIIYETLQSAVGASQSSRKPKSLNEVVTKRSSAFLPRKEEKRVDPFMARMKALAGIND